MLRHLQFAAIAAMFALAACSSSASSLGPTRPPHGTIVEFAVPTASAAPGSIVLGPDGNLWFLEDGESGSFANQVAKITPTGVITEYPLGTINAFPANIVSGPDGNLWYVDEANHLGKITTGGTVTLYPATDPSSVAVGPDHNLWVTEFNGMKVDVYNTSGSLIHSYASNTNPSNLQLEFITAGPDGNMWFDTFSGDNVVKMVTGTGATTTFTYSPTIQNTMRQITSGPDGNLWLCAQDDNNIAKITTAGALTVYPIPSANAKAFGIAAGPDGNVWFTEGGGNLPPAYVNKVGSITPSGTVTEYHVPTAQSGVTYITAGPSSTIWFTESLTDKVGELFL